MLLHAFGNAGFRDFVQNILIFLVGILIITGEVQIFLLDFGRRFQALTENLQLGLQFGLLTTQRRQVVLGGSDLGDQRNISWIVGLHNA